MQSFRHLEQRDGITTFHLVLYWSGPITISFHSISSSTLNPSTLRNLSDSVALRLRPCRPLIELSVMADSDEDELFEMWNRQTLFIFSAAEDRDVR
jgi:hypothetical protein